MAFQQGDVLLVPFPFTDLSTIKARPAVVVSGASYQRSEPDIILAAITSQVGAARSTMDYVLVDWSAAGLRFPSAFKPVLFTLDPQRVLHRLGSLTSQDRQEVLVRLRRMFAL